MVRNYKRKTNREAAPHDVMKKAVEDVDKKLLSLHGAARKCDLNYCTLRRYYLKYKHNPEVSLVPSYIRNRIFTPEQEDELADYLKVSSKMGFGFDVKSFRILGQQLAAKKNLKMPESWDRNQTAGIEWYRGFLKRNQTLSVRTALNKSIARTMCFDETTVATFFDNLESILRKNPSLHDGTRIYNLDETSTTTVPSKALHVSAEK